MKQIILEPTPKTFRLGAGAKHFISLKLEPEIEFGFTALV